MLAATSRALAAAPGRLAARSAARRLESTFVVTAVGTDRVGLVADVAKSVAAHGGSLSQSQMLRLGGSFALLAQVTLADELRRFDLEGALASELGLKAMVEPALGEASAAIEAGPPMFDAVVRLDGADHPGLVARVAEFVSARGLAIEKLETALDTAPFGGAAARAPRRVADEAQAPAPLSLRHDALSDVVPRHEPRVRARSRARTPPSLSVCLSLSLGDAEAEAPPLARASRAPRAQGMSRSRRSTPSSRASATR